MTCTTLSIVQPIPSPCPAPVQLHRPPSPSNTRRCATRTIALSACTSYLLHKASYPGMPCFSSTEVLHLFFAAFSSVNRAGKVRTLRRRHSQVSYQLPVGLPRTSTRRPVRHRYLPPTDRTRWDHEHGTPLPTMEVRRRPREPRSSHDAAQT